MKNFFDVTKTGRRDRLLTAIFLSAAFSIGGCASFEPASPFEILPLGDHVTMLRSNSEISNPSTVVVRSGGRVMVIDPGLIDDAPLIFQWISDAGMDEVRAVASTHAHADHSHGFEFFYGHAITMATVEQRLTLERKPLTSPDSPPMIQAALPEVMLETGATIWLGDAEVTAYRPPVAHAHTDGDLLFFIGPDNVLVAGDIVMYRRFPIIDSESSGSLQGYVCTLDWIVDTFPADTVVVPGHSTFPPDTPVAMTMNAVREYRDTLVASMSLLELDLSMNSDDDLAEHLEIRFNSYFERPRFVSPASWAETLRHNRNVENELCDS
jgi:glyoxylase-like metal-dependent hydrolase (beta-lactamase superfamily II)